MPTYPAVHATTERIYNGLPEVYRDVDATAPEPGYPLLRYLSLVTDQLGAAADTAARIDYVPPDDPEYDEALDGDRTSDLVDPATADAAWLPWLAATVGITLNAALTEAAQREQISGAAAGWQVGSRGALVVAAQAALTGTRSVRVTVTGPHTATIITDAAETPGGPASVLAAIEAGRARPAGILLSHSYYTATWATVEAAYPTWAGLEAAGSWAAVESTL